MKIPSWLLLLLLATVLFLTGCGNTSTAEEYVGEVDGIKITRSEYHERCVLLQSTYKIQQEVYTGTTVEELSADVLKELEDGAFDDMVYQKLLLREAENRKIKVTEEEVAQAIDEFKLDQLQGNEENYSSFLEQTGLDDEKFKQEMKMELIISRVRDDITANISVTEEEAQAYYDENSSLYTQPAGIQISHILVDSEEQANQILDKLNSGEDFPRLAREFSQCGSASEGGDLGIVNEATTFVPEFLSAALALETGEITKKPVKSDFGYHIIKAGERKEESIQEFASVKNSILIQLQQQKETGAFNDFVEELKHTADIKDYRDSE